MRQCHGLPQETHGTAAIAEEAHKAIDQGEEEQVLCEDGQAAHVEALLVGVVELGVLGAREHVVPQQVTLDEDEDNRVLPEFL